MCHGNHNLWLVTQAHLAKLWKLSSSFGVHGVSQDKNLLFYCFLKTITIAFSGKNISREVFHHNHLSLYHYLYVDPVTGALYSFLKIFDFICRTSAPENGTESWQRLWFSSFSFSNHEQVCSIHFVDEKPTKDHPYPSLQMGYITHVSIISNPSISKVVLLSWV